jgi:hypothetical protein
LLLKRLHDENPPCIYRARSFWEEAVGVLPKAGTKVKWVNGALRERAARGVTNKDGYESPLPVRERMTAAWVYLWRVAQLDTWEPRNRESLRKHLSPGSRKELREFADRLAGKEEHPSLQGQARDRGLVYASEFIRCALDDDVFWYPCKDNEVLRDKKAGFLSWWSEVDEAQIVAEALAMTFATNKTTEGFTKTAVTALVSQACLTIDGVSRREALATLQYSGREALATDAFWNVIVNARKSSTATPSPFRWLIENATFGLGWMQQIDAAEEILVEIATSDEAAYDDSIRMTALMAIGDMAERIRQAGREDAPRREIRQLLQSLEGLDQLPRDGAYAHKLIARSGLYVLSMLRHPDDVDILDRFALAPCFEELTTPALAQWGLDRIQARMHNETVQTPSTFAHQSIEIGYRRLVDPMASLHHVKERRAAEQLKKRAQRRQRK